MNAKALLMQARSASKSVSCSLLPWVPWVAMPMAGITPAKLAAHAVAPQAS